MGKKKKKYDEEMCSYLNDYIDSEVTLTLYTGHVVSGELSDITKNGLVVIKETEILSPFANQSISLVRCNDIMIATIQTEM